MSNIVSKGKPGRKPLAEGEKRTTVATTLDAAQYAALEDYRWNHRINTMGDVVRQAIVAFIASPDDELESETSAE